MPVSYGGADVVDLAKRMHGKKSAPPGWAERRQERVAARHADKYGDQPAPMAPGKPAITPTRAPGAPVGPTTSPVSPPPLRTPGPLPTTPQIPPVLRPGQQPLRPGVQPQPNEPLITSPYQMPWPTSGPTLFGTGQSPFRDLSMTEVNPGY